MAFRDVLSTRVAPFLEPGEIPRQTFPAQGGLNPWLASALGLVGALGLVKRRIVAVTDRDVVVLQANVNGTKPTKVLTRLPRHTRIGPVKGVWATTRLGDEKLYVHWKFHKDVRAADGALLS